MRQDSDFGGFGDFGGGDGGFSGGSDGFGGGGRSSGLTAESSRGFDFGGAVSQPAPQPGSGGLNVPMTAACLLGVTAVSFLVSWLMRGTVRNEWQMGLTFAAPFAALMLCAMLTEHATGRMTPSCSRGAQLICMAATIAGAFLVGVLAESLHQPVVERYDYVFMLDKSGSMVFENLDEPSRKAMHDMVAGMEEADRVGFVAFDNSIRASVPIGRLDAERRRRVEQAIETEIPIVTHSDGTMEGAGTDFSAAFEETRKLIETRSDQSHTVRVILVTDGDDQVIGSPTAFSAWMRQVNAGRKRVELCAVQLGGAMLPMVKDAVRGSGGLIYDNTNPAELLSALQEMDETITVDTLKATYAGKTADGRPNTQYKILTCVFLVILGLLCGLSLMVMFSLSGQFRFQVILSPLMGIAAFLLFNWGRLIGIAPAWICEAIAFSLFGLVLMRGNGLGAAPAVSKTAPPAQFPPDADGFGTF